MNVRFQCRICSAPISGRLSERFVRCPKCGATSPVPAPEDAVESPSSEEPRRESSSTGTDPIRDDVFVPCAGFRFNPFAFTAALEAPIPQEDVPNDENAKTTRGSYVKFDRRGKTNENEEDAFSDDSASNAAFPGSPSVDDLIAPFLNEGDN